MHSIDDELSSNSELKYYGFFIEKLSFDLNIPQCLALLWDLFKEDELTNLEKIKIALKFDNILALNLKKEILQNKSEYFTELDDSMIKLIDERRLAKNKGDFKRADEIRDYFMSKGFTLIDTKDGTKVKKGD